MTFLTAYLTQPVSHLLIKKKHNEVWGAVLKRGLKDKQFNVHVNEKCALCWNEKQGDWKKCTEIHFHIIMKLSQAHSLISH